MCFPVGYLQIVSNTVMLKFWRQNLPRKVFGCHLCVGKLCCISSGSLSIREIMWCFILGGDDSGGLCRPFFGMIYPMMQRGVQVLRQAQCWCPCRSLRGYLGKRGLSPAGDSCAWVLGPVGLHLSQMCSVCLKCRSLLKANIWLTETSVCRESFCQYYFSHSFTMWL